MSSPTVDSTADSKAPGRGFLWPVVAMALAFAAALAVWMPLTDGVRVRPIWPDGNDSDFFVTDTLPFPWFAHGDPASASLLVIGDSRAHSDIDVSQLESLGQGPSAILWRPMADLQELLDAAIELEPDRAVVLLAPSGFEKGVQDIVLKAFEGGSPISDPAGATRAEVYRWVEERKAKLLEEGSSEMEIDMVLGPYRAYHARIRGRKAPFSRHIDHVLGRRFQLARAKRVRVVQSEFFPQGWFGRDNPGQTRALHDNALEPAAMPGRIERTKPAIVRKLRRLAEVCPTVAVRVPIQPLMRTLEDSRVDPSVFAEIAEEAGVPFLDLGVSTDAHDGVHLNVRGMEEATTRIAEFLDEAGARVEPR